MQVRQEGGRGGRAPKPEGFVVWMTGLPGSGKSTIARLVSGRLREEYGRNVEVLDGDEIRKGLSRDLGLSREDREEHNHRVAYVAKVLSRNGVVVISALIAPYASSRAAAKEMIGPERFVETFIRAPLAVCEKRDPKGLYARARRGEITNMTGIQDPFEEPKEPDIVVDTSRSSPDESAAFLVEELRLLGRL